MYLTVCREFPALQIGPDLINRSYFRIEFNQSVVEFPNDDAFVTKKTKGEKSMTFIEVSLLCFMKRFDWLDCTGQCY